MTTVRFSKPQIPLDHELVSAYFVTLVWEMVDTSGFGLGEIADKMGVPETEVQQILDAPMESTPESLSKLAWACGCSMEFSFADEKHQSQKHIEL